jgi:hypothetical protein
MAGRPPRREFRPDVLTGGDTIGFWDGDALTWTANVQGWNQHSSWEWSDGSSRSKS